MTVGGTVQKERPQANSPEGVHKELNKKAMARAHPSLGCGAPWVIGRSLGRYLRVAHVQDCGREGREAGSRQELRSGLEKVVLPSGEKWGSVSGVTSGFWNTARAEQHPEESLHLIYFHKYPNKPGWVLHTCNTSICETKAEGSQISSQSG